MSGRTMDDGHSRPFGEGSTARHVIAETLAVRDEWGEIRPAHWATAGALVRQLRAAGYGLRKKANP